MQDLILCRIGTRGSPLALAQAHEVRRRLCTAHSLLPENFEIVKIKTEGDRNWSKPLAELGGKELFTREIETTLAGGEIDCAVHSAKDMPTDIPNGLALDIFLPRQDVADCLITRDGSSIDELPHGAVLGTSSLRRAALIRHLRPDIRIVDIRGNVDTRISKVESGSMDATILAQAGLNRLGLDVSASKLIAPDFPPAPGQGAICIESRSADNEMTQFLSVLNHADTHAALICERSFLSALDGSCRTPMAGYAFVNSGEIHFSASVLSPSGEERIDSNAKGPLDQATSLGLKVANDLLEQGAARLLGGN